MCSILANRSIGTVWILRSRSSWCLQHATVSIEWIQSDWFKSKERNWGLRHFYANFFPRMDNLEQFVTFCTLNGLNKVCPKSAKVLLILSDKCIRLKKVSVKKDQLLFTVQLVNIYTKKFCKHSFALFSSRCRTNGCISHVKCCSGTNSIRRCCWCFSNGETFAYTTTCTCANWGKELQNEKHWSNISVYFGF